MTETHAKTPDQMTDAERAAAELVNKSMNGPATAPKRSGETVTVACKLPNGMILQHWRMQAFRDPVLGGGHREVQRAVEDGAPVKVHGPTVPFGIVPRFLIVGGYALTTGISKDFWDKWRSQNKDHDSVVNRLIFAMPTMDAAQAMADEQSEITSGLQPMLPDKDKRVPRSSNPALTTVATAEAPKAA